MDTKNRYKSTLILMLFLLNNFLFITGRDYERIEPEISPKKSILGTIKLPENLSADSYLYLCYKGEVLKVHQHDTYFIIKDSDNSDINIIFTSPENISFCAEENTIFCLKLSSNYKYKFYKLSKKEKDNQMLTWEINETKLSKKNKNNEIKIPLNTLIVPLDANEVNVYLENNSWKKTGKLIKLPTIIIKELNNKEKIEDQFLKCCLSFIDLKPFHAKQDKREINHDNLKISLLVNNNE